MTARRVTPPDAREQKALDPGDGVVPGVLSREPRDVRANRAVRQQPRHGLPDCAGVGLAVPRSWPTPRAATRTATNGLSSVAPATTTGVPAASACCVAPKPPLVTEHVGVREQGAR